MGKILFITIIIALIYFIISSKFQKRDKNDESVQNFVECDCCKTYVDINETKSIGNGKFICKECLDANYRS